MKSNEENSSDSEIDSFENNSNPSGREYDPNYSQSVSTLSAKYNSEINKRFRKSSSAIIPSLNQQTESYFQELGCGKLLFKEIDIKLMKNKTQRIL